MAEQNKQEAPTEGWKRRASTGLGKRVKLALAGMAAVATVTGAIGLNKFNQDGAEVSRSIPAETLQARTELNFLDWYRLPRETQEATALFLEGRAVVLNVNTSDLRLHTKLVNPGHVLVDLNVYPDKEPLPPAGPNYSGKPVEMRLTTEQYQVLKDEWRAEPSGNDIDIIVPTGTKLNVKPQRLPRGTSPTEITTQLVFQDYTPPSQ